MSIFRTFGFFLTWWGVILLSALDSSVFFFVPFGNDALVVYLAARDRQQFWLYPILTTVGSVLGAAVTFWIGRKIGEKGLARFVEERRLERLKRRVSKAGGIALALPAVLPPPFPLGAFVLTSGALEVSRSRFFAVFAAARILRFGAEALLARRYGEGVLGLMHSDRFQWVVGAFIVVAVGGTVLSGVSVWRRRSAE